VADSVIVLSSRGGGAPMSAASEIPVEDISKPHDDTKPQEADKPTQESKPTSEPKTNNSKKDENKEVEEIDIEDIPF
jgi:hypothetical protein